MTALPSLGLVLLLLAVTEVGAQDDQKILQERLHVRETAYEALASLYEIQPGARFVIQHAAGYAVFSTFGIKVLFAGGTTGKGVVHNARTGRDTFMNMLQVQAGLGVGAKKTRMIWVFETQRALSDFVNTGWDFGGQATATAMVKEQGGMFSGAVSVAPGVYLYQLTDTGLAVELTLTGTKFYRNDELN